MEEELEKRIPCAQSDCSNLTGFVPSDFDEHKDFDEIYRSEGCRYNAETGHPHEEY